MLAPSRCSNSRQRTSLRQSCCTAHNKAPDTAKPGPRGVVLYCSGHSLDHFTLRKLSSCRYKKVARDTLIAGDSTNGVFAATGTGIGNAAGTSVYSVAYLGLLQVRTVASLASCM